MGLLTSSGVTVFDLKQNMHVYASESFFRTFAYDFHAGQKKIKNGVFDKRIHPADLPALAAFGERAIQFLNALPAKDKMCYKMVTTYRICSSKGSYIRVIEQQQLLELDLHGNPLFSLGIIDISADQSTSSMKATIHNVSTGELVNLHPEKVAEQHLSPREMEILGMIGDGKFSKEIAAELAISVHTVNTHRQRILEKLHADNAIEAVSRARDLGILRL